MTTRRQVIGLMLFLLAVAAVAAAGAVFTASGTGSWYASLQKPAWTPPDWLFGPAWTVLYLTMAVAAWLVWQQEGLAGARLPLTAFSVQLLLNGAWSPLFFACKCRGWLSQNSSCSGWRYLRRWCFSGGDRGWPGRCWCRTSCGSPMPVHSTSPSGA